MANLRVKNSGTGTDKETDLSTVPVPESARMPKFGLTMAWWSMCSAIFLLIVGATLALNYGARNAIIGMLLSAISFAVINGIFSRYAIRTGYSVALLSRAVFGRAGASVVILIFAATNIYFAVFESSVVALALKRMLPALSYAVAAMIVVIYSVSLMFGSVQNWLDKLNGVLLPLYLIGLAGAVIMAINVYGYDTAWIDFGPEKGPPEYGWWNCYMYYMGICAYMMATVDFARFGRERDTKYHSLFTFGLPFWLLTFMLNGIVGIFLVSTIPTGEALSEVSVVFALLALMGIWGFLFVLVTQTRINTASYFLAILNTHAFFVQALRWSFPRAFWVVVVGVIVYVLMLADVFSYLLQALAYQGVFLVAWVGVVLSFILSPLGRIKGDAENIDAVPALAIGAVLAWLTGTVCGVLLMHSSYSYLSVPAVFALSVVGHRLSLIVSSRTVTVVSSAGC